MGIDKTPRRSSRANRGRRRHEPGFVSSMKMSRHLLNSRVSARSKVILKLPRVVGRSGSAPLLQWKPPKGSGTFIFPDVTKTLSTDAWNDITKKGIRLVYPKLDPTGGNYQGIFIPDNAISSSTDTHLHQHFDAVRDSMMTKQNSRQITEATGEAATALAMRRRFPGAKMQWGLHVHKGPGIDQIWKETDAHTGQAIYYVVEAKGVNATLTYKNVGPPDEIKQQMSLGWVLDNLARMARQDGSEFNIAREMMDHLGLEERLNDDGDAFYQGFDGASKSYYACSYDASERTAELIGVVATADWSSGSLSAVISPIINFSSQLATSSAIKN